MVSGLRQSSPARAGRRERHRAETRKRLFEAALKLFAERGYLETTVEDITEAADVGKGTFFNYFPTKEHVLATLGAERVAAVEHALEKAKSGPVLPALKELATDLAGQSSSPAALLRAIYAAHASCAPVRAELQKAVPSRKETPKSFAFVGSPDAPRTVVVERKPSRRAVSAGAALKRADKLSANERGGRLGLRQS